MGNSALVLAGTGPEDLAWFADEGTAHPTEANPFAALTGYETPGFCVESGAVTSYASETQGIPAYGTNQDVRTLLIRETTTVAIGFRETNRISQAVYRRMPISGPDAPSIGSDGILAVTDGPMRDPVYVFITDAVDGANHVRKIYPRVRVTGRDPESVAKAANLAYSLTLTAEPDEDGVAVYTFFLLDALKTDSSSSSSSSSSS